MKLIKNKIYRILYKSDVTEYCDYNNYGSFTGKTHLVNGKEFGFFTILDPNDPNFNGVESFPLSSVFDDDRWSYELPTKAGFYWYVPCDKLTGKSLVDNPYLVKIFGNPLTLFPISPALPLETTPVTKLSSEVNKFIFIPTPEI